MNHTKKITLDSYPVDRAIRAGDFRLLPENPSLPIVVSQPNKNFSQFTWIQSYNNNTPVVQEIEIQNNTVNMLEFTEFSLGFKAIDPSNVNNANDTTNLSYKWRKDGALIYELNALNGGVGVSSFLVNANEAIADLSGRYSCEVTNQYGTIETDYLKVNIINTLKHPKIFKNLILNGDGEGGLNGWEGDSEIKTSAFLDNIMVTQNFGSFRLAGLQTFYYKGYDVGISKESSTSQPDFYFSKGNHGSLFFPKFWKAWSNDPNFRDIGVKEKTAALNDWEWWSLAGILPQIVLNEDFEKSNNAGFFPGPLWMDTYNKNQNVTGLVDEFKDYTSAYFTRDLIKFEKFGGKQSANLTQIVDLTAAADFIDGTVYGVQYTTSQFFAYVGAGITRYLITVQTTEGEKTFNYNIADTEDLFNHIFGNVLTDAYISPSPNRDVYTYESDLFVLGNRIKLLPDSEIKVVPVVDDVTTIYLDFVNDKGEILKTEVIDGPNETDVWAIKEKVYFPLTLYGIFEFIRPSGNNPITVFGQKYTDTNALAPFFVNAGTSSALTTTNPASIANPYIPEQLANNPTLLAAIGPGDRQYFQEGWEQGFNAAGGAINPYASSPPYSPIGNAAVVVGSARKEGWSRGYSDNPLHQVNSSTGAIGPLAQELSGPSSDLVRDINAKFLLRKFPFKQLGSAYPGGFINGRSPSLENKSSYRAIQDFGAAAMFGVGKNTIVPYNTRSVQVRVEFKHKSEIMRDTNPEGKGWKLQEIYADDNGQSTGRSKRLLEYGTPRCAITKVKFLLAPNNIGASEDYATFSIPPANSTVLGLQKQKYTDPTAFNTADKITFNYELTLPVNLPEPPAPSDQFTRAKTEQEYLDSLKQNNYQTAETIAGSEEVGMETSNLPQSAEDEDGHNHGEGDEKMSLEVNKP